MLLVMLVRWTYLISNPHDKFVRSALSEVATARGFIAKSLPAKVVTLLNLPTLELPQDSFVDAQLGSSQSDLLYRVSLHSGDEALVYVLLEHKSVPNRMVAFQLLRYMVRIWEQCLREGNEICPITPLILYHGERPWSTAQCNGIDNTIIVNSREWQDAEVVLRETITGAD